MFFVGLASAADSSSDPGEGGGRNVACLLKIDVARSDISDGLGDSDTLGDQHPLRIFVEIKCGGSTQWQSRFAHHMWLDEVFGTLTLGSSNTGNSNGNGSNGNGRPPVVDNADDESLEESL